MKKFILLTIVMALLLCGCGAQETLVPETEPTAAPTEPQSEAPTQETTVPETEATAQKTGVWVEDRHYEEFTQPSGEGTFCFHIPKFLVDGDDQLSVNNKIYNDHMRKLHENANNGQPTVSAAYAMGEANGYASVITCFNHQDHEFVEYSVFNINTANGQEATNQQILDAYGYNPDTFRVAVRKIMEQRFDSDNASMRETVGDETYRQVRAEHLSDTNISGAKPYIDASGRLCFVVKFYTFEGDGYCYNRVCLEDPASYPAPQVIACSVHG